MNNYAEQMQRFGECNYYYSGNTYCQPGEFIDVDVIGGKLNVSVDCYALLSDSGSAEFDTDAVEAHRIMGAVAAIKFRQQDMDRHYQTALRLEASAFAHNDYAISLQLAQRRDDAATQAAMASEKDPLDLDYARRAIRYLGIAGRLGEAMQHIERFERRFPNEALPEGGGLSLVLRNN
jgi:hypothetical protein